MASLHSILYKYLSTFCVDKQYIPWSTYLAAIRKYGSQQEPCSQTCLGGAQGGQESSSMANGGQTASDGYGFYQIAKYNLLPFVHELFVLGMAQHIGQTPDFVFTQGLKGAVRIIKAHYEANDGLIEELEAEMASHAATKAKLAEMEKKLSVVKSMI
jgi:hypothetical protein